MSFDTLNGMLYTEEIEQRPLNEKGPRPHCSNYNGTARKHPQCVQSSLKIAAGIHYYHVLQGVAVTIPNKDAQLRSLATSPGSPKRVRVTNCLSRESRESSCYLKGKCE